MYKKMLVPLDGSPIAEEVLPFVKQIGDRLNLDVVYLHVCDHSESSMKFVWRAYIHHVAELVKTKIPGRGEVIMGDPAGAIINYAEINNVDLMLIATHGQSGFLGWATGSTAHRVITTSKIPVVLIRPDAGKNQISQEWPKTVLMPLDGSALAESIIPHVETLEQQGKVTLEVTLFKVCEPPDLIGDYPEASMPLTWEEHVKRATAAAEHTCGTYLDEVQQRLKAAGIHVRSEVILGNKDNVARNIIDYADKSNFDLIAMSTHGRSGISVWPYGHVVDNLVQAVSMPLFLIRPGKSQ